MSADKLCGGVDYDVGSVLDGAYEDWGEGVVDDEDYAVAVGNLGDALEVGHVGVGIAEGLGIDDLSLGAYGCFEGLEVVDADDGVGDALRGEGMSDEVERASVEIVGSDDVVSDLQHVLQSVGDRCCSAGYGEGCHTAFDGCYALLKYVLGRVGETAVDIAGIAESETVGGVL